MKSYGDGVITPQKLHEELENSTAAIKDEIDQDVRELQREIATLDQQTLRHFSGMSGYMTDMHKSHMCKQKWFLILLLINLGASLLTGCLLIYTLLEVI